MTRHTPWYKEAHESAVRWKNRTKTIPDEARTPGHTWVTLNGRPTKVGPFPVCLPLGYADYNLVAEIREEALVRWARNGIQWHGATPRATGPMWPSSHLLDSQVQCVNVLLSLAQKPERLLAAILPHVRDAVRLVTVEDGSPVAFEWIGHADYLGEGRGQRRRRGQYTTSLDALIVVERDDGGRTGLAIEWKFTEFYDAAVGFHGPGGTDRRQVYHTIYHGSSSPFDEKPDIEAFFHEPHYQLMRQALLAGRMVEADEFGIDEAVLLHMVPFRNTDLLGIVPPGLAVLGNTVGDVWGKLLPGHARPRVRYALVDTLPWMSLIPEVSERYGDLRL